LDEPTNDLDLPTLAVLEQFLIDFAGCVLLVSHDRYFMDKLVDHLFIFEGNGVIRDYPGNYTQFRILEKTKQNYAAVSSDISRAQDFSVPVKEETTAVQAPPTNIKKAAEKLSFKEKTELDNLNKNIPAMEEKKKLLTEKLNDSSLAYDKIIELSETLGALNSQLEIAELRWLVLNEKI
jgi:ATP-binding cassette subfamily F protein uup